MIITFIYLYYIKKRCNLQTPNQGVIVKILFLTSLITLSTYSYAFNSGDKIKCTDDVSGFTYLIKIIDIGDEEAYIKVQANSRNHFYPSSRVIFDENSEGAIFQMLSSDNQRIVEEIFIPHPVSGSNIIFGDYIDGGDSRVVECHIL